MLVSISAPIQIWFVLSSRCGVPSAAKLNPSTSAAPTLLITRYPAVVTSPEGGAALGLSRTSSGTNAIVVGVGGRLGAGAAAFWQAASNSASRQATTERVCLCTKL